MKMHKKSAALQSYLATACVNCAGKSIWNCFAFQYRGKTLTAAVTSIKVERMRWIHTWLGHSSQVKAGNIKKREREGQRETERKRVREKKGRDKHCKTDGDKRRETEGGGESEREKS